MVGVEGVVSFFEEKSRIEVGVALKEGHCVIAAVVVAVVVVVLLYLGLFYDYDACTCFRFCFRFCFLFLYFFSSSSEQFTKPYSCLLSLTHIPGRDKKDLFYSTGEWLGISGTAQSYNIYIAYW